VATGSESDAGPTDHSDLPVATFAGGCFWCLEASFDGLPGVVSAVSGYTGGTVVNPTYEQVSTGNTGHLESVEVRYDPSQITYERLLSVFWRQIDPTDGDGQFADRGSQYRTAIFYHDEEQRQQAEASEAALQASGRYSAPIVTEIRPAGPFYVAGEYHQDFHDTNPNRYTSYRSGSGRDRYLEQVWGNDPQGRCDADAPADHFERPSDEQMRECLTPTQYEVTQENGTEPAFQNPYWNNHRSGIYVDVVSGEPLFSSQDKFDSGTGWPSYMRPLVPGNLVERADRSHGMTRIEVRSRLGDSHLGHLFDDGPAPCSPTPA